MTPEELQEQINKNSAELNELRELFYKGKFSNMDSFQGKVKVGGGLILASSSTPISYDGQEGESMFYNNGTTKQLCSFLSGSWICQDIGISEGLADVVDDTTPQLGGNLDTNDKGFLSEGGKIARYTINKSLADNTLTNLFRVAFASAGGAYITVQYSIQAYVDADGHGMYSGILPTNIFYDGSTNSSGTASPLGGLVLESSGTYIGLTWAWETGTPGTFNFSLTANNAGDVTGQGSFLITIVSPNNAFTYTEL